MFYLFSLEIHLGAVCRAYMPRNETHSRALSLCRFLCVPSESRRGNEKVSCVVPYHNFCNGPKCHVGIEGSVGYRTKDSKTYTHMRFLLGLFIRFRILSIIPYVGFVGIPFYISQTITPQPATAAVNSCE